MKYSLKESIRAANFKLSINSRGWGGSALAAFDPATLDLVNTVHRWSDKALGWLFRQDTNSYSAESTVGGTLKRSASDSLFDTGSAYTYDLDWLYGTPQYQRSTEGVKWVGGFGERLRKEPIPTVIDPRATGFAFGVSLVCPTSTVTGSRWAFGDDGSPLVRALRIAEDTAIIEFGFDASTPVVSFDLVDLTTRKDILVNCTPLGGNSVKGDLYVNGELVATNALTCSANVSRFRDQSPNEITIVREFVLGRTLTSSEVTSVLGFMQFGRPSRFGRFNNTDRQTDVVLTDLLMTATLPGSWISARSTGPKLNSASFELEFTSGSYCAVGVATKQASVNDWLGGDAYGWGIMSHGYTTNGGAAVANGKPFSTGSKILVVVDRDNDEVNYYIDGASTPDVTQDISAAAGLPLYFMVSGISAVVKVETNSTLFTNTLDTTGWVEEI